MAHETWSPALLYLFGLVIMEPLLRRAEEAMARKDAEQSAYDREFWELVTDGTG